MVLTHLQAYELSTLTGTQVLLLVASETGHVYTFATRKLQPMITSETGKALIQTCLNSPDSPPRDPSGDQRMSATGFEETDLTYQVAEADAAPEAAKVRGRRMPSPSGPGSVYGVCSVSVGSGEAGLRPAFLLFLRPPAEQRPLLAASGLLQQRRGAEDSCGCSAPWRAHLDVR